MLDRFVDAGGTLVDTADVYGDGRSERTLAPWLARRRDAVVLATKVRFAVSIRAARASPPTASAPPATRACGGSAPTSSTSTRCTRPTRRPAGGDARGARRPRARRQGARARRLELPGLAAGVGGRAAGPPRLVAVRVAAGAVLARRALDRARGAAVLPRRRPRRAAVGPARRGLPQRPLPPRRGDAGGQPHGRRRRRPRGGAGAARDRAQLRRRRRRARRSPPRTARPSPQVAIAWLLGVEAWRRRSSGRARRSTWRTCSGAADARADARGAGRAGRPRPAAGGSIPSGCCAEQVGLERVTGPLRRPGRARTRGRVARPRGAGLVGGQADRAGDARAADAAVAVGVLRQVLLVVVLGVEERAGRGDLGGDLAVAGAAQRLPGSASREASAASQLVRRSRRRSRCGTGCRRRCPGACPGSGRGPPRTPSAAPRRR